MLLNWKRNNLIPTILTPVGHICSPTLGDYLVSLGLGRIMGLVAGGGWVEIGAWLQPIHLIRDRGMCGLGVWSKYLVLKNGMSWHVLTSESFEPP